MQIQQKQKIDAFERKFQEQEKLISALEQEITSSKLELHHIEKAVQECMKKENYTTSGMSRCVDASVYDWQHEINKTLIDLKKVLPKNKYNLLLESQSKWDIYKNSMLTVLDNTIGEKQGTIYINILSADKANIVEKRARELKSLYYFLTE